MPTYKTPPHPISTNLIPEASVEQAGGTSSPETTPEEHSATSAGLPQTALPQTTPPETQPGITTFSAPETTSEEHTESSTTFDEVVQTAHSQTTALPSTLKPKT